MNPRATTDEAAERWASTWKAGWERFDPDPVVELYAPDAIFSTQPFRTPYRGRDGVRQYVVTAFAEEEKPRVWMSRPIVDGDRASISWWASLTEDGAETTLAGTSILRFDADGLVVEQWDAWNQLPERRNPPDELGPFRS
jgi:ketosteroid isomerase-like protein